MFWSEGKKSVENSSWIRKMFEEGERLAKIYGEENVFNFSLGNPYKEPPKKVKETVNSLMEQEGLHKYMTNAGFIDVREKIAAHLNKESETQVTGRNIIMTSGAAGGLNVVLKSLLNKGEEIIVFAPYFVEYGFYAGNHGGKLKVVDTEKNNFIPNGEMLKGALNQNTKAIILNSPNNPSGALYPKEVIEELGEVLRQWEAESGNKVFIISDEPYTEIVYDGHKVPKIMDYYDNTIIATSFSKSLGLAGQRIGYVVVSPKIKEFELLVDIMVFCNRTLGFVSASALWQKVAGECVAERVDIEDYREKRDMLYNHLTKLGFEVRKPEGTFYLFPKSPIKDDFEFTKLAVKHNILIVPGSGFGMPGYFRISYCVPNEVVERSLRAWTELAEEVIKK